MVINWNDVLEKIIHKEECAAARNQNKIPYSADEEGNFDDRSKDISWWTNGFWAGLLWQLYGVCRDGRFRAEAQEIERKLDESFMSAEGMDHDSGFKWLLTANADLLLTGSGESKNRLLLAAGNLAGRFNPAGNFLRAWNDETGEKAGWAIIDCMMNLPLLYRASEICRDPRFYAIAFRHAQTAQRYFVREDGSVCHIVRFDPQTGEFLGSLKGQGMKEGSSWTRGQGWALYGFALSYRHTHAAEFLETAERVAQNFITRMQEFGHMPVDFCQTSDCPFEDSSAAAIASCGLLELFSITGKEEYSAAAEGLLEGLLADRCDLSTESDRLLTHCSAAYHDERHNFPLIYGDYFFIEAVLKILKKETFLW